MAAAAREVEDRRCRFLVRLPGVPGEPLAAALAALVAADRLAGVIGPATPEIADFAASLPTALLATDEAGGVDGVVVAVDEDAPEAVGWARREGGADAIVIADVGTSRHAAMEAGEAGADAILFTGDAASVDDCVGWWSELFVLPVAAPVPPAGVAGPVVAGADFLMIEGERLADEAFSLAAWLEAVTAAEHRRPPVPPAA